MSFPYKHVLLIGATAGIGRALADRFVETGIKVTAVGRRQERLDKFVHTHGEDKASSAVFDIGDIANIPEFAKNVIAAHPDIDCIFLNAGTQTVIDLANPAGFDLNQFNQEFSVNFTRFVTLTNAFLPFLQKKDTPTSVIFTSSNLAIIPMTVAPAYSASKAALNVFALSLRTALQNTKVKVIELSPPPVQTELHDYMGEEKGRAFGMPLGQFTDLAHKGFLEGKDQIIIGAIGPEDVFNDIVNKRRAAAEHLDQVMRSLH